MFIRRPVFGTLVVVGWLTSQASGALAQDYRASAEQGVLLRSNFQKGQKLREVKVKEVKTTEALPSGEQAVVVTQVQQYLDWEVIAVDSQDNATIRKTFAGGDYAFSMEVDGKKVREDVEDANQDPSLDSQHAKPHLKVIRDLRGKTMEVLLSARNETLRMRFVAKNGLQEVPIGSLADSDRLIRWPEEAVKPGDEWEAQLGDQAEPGEATARARWKYVGRETIDGRTKDNLTMEFERAPGEILSRSQYIYSPELKHSQMVITTFERDDNSQIREITMFFDTTNAAAGPSSEIDDESATSRPSTRGAKASKEQDLAVEFEEYFKAVVLSSKSPSEFLKSRAGQRFADWRAQAEQGLPIAQVFFGLCLFHGVEVPANSEEAAKWWLLAEKQGNIEARSLLGDHYLSSYLDALSSNERHLDEKAAKTLVTETHGGKLEQAVEWLRSAAAEGHPSAQANLGLCYEFGHGVVSDISQAAAHYEQAAKQGHLFGINALGTCYVNGAGRPKDPRKAVELFREAATAGFDEAQSNLGKRYFLGDGVPQDQALAVEWFERAAEQGNVDVQFLLTTIYANGEGVERDMSKALFWCQQAAAQGSADAQQALPLLLASLNPGPQPKPGAKNAPSWSPYDKGAVEFDYQRKENAKFEQ